MEPDIQKIFSQYGISNKMHNDAYNWWKKYIEISNKISSKNEWREACYGFFFLITFWLLICFGLAFVNELKNSSKIINTEEALILIIPVLLNIFLFLKGKKEDERQKEYIKQLEKHKKEKSNYSEYENKENQIICDYTNKLKNLHDKLYGKRINAEFNENLNKYKEIIDICHYINGYLVFNHINTFEHDEYAKKRENAFGCDSNNNLSHSKKAPSKIEEDYSSSKPIKNSNIKNKFNPQKTDWLELSKSNAKLGEYGERIIVELEKNYLTENGLANLAEKVEWISRTKGDGAGYDILSYNVDGSRKYIEVKTTCISENEPFYMSNNELAFLRTYSNSSFIYRLYVDKATNEIKLKVFNSSEIAKLTLQAVSYKVSF